MRNHLAFLCIILPLLTIAAAPLPPVTTEVVSAKAGALTLSIRDANGVPPAALGKDQFTLREDSGPDLPAAQAEAYTEQNTRVALALVIDVSGSMEGKPLNDAKAAAKQLLAALGPDDRAAVMAFSDKVKLAEPFPQLDEAKERDFTINKLALANFVDGLSAGGNTSLYDAAVKAVRLTAREGSSLRRAVIFLTDGRDEVAGGAVGSGSETYNDDSAIFEAKANRVPIFTIGLGNFRDKAFLTRLATLTGGDFLDTPDSAQLTAQFRTVLNRMKTMYRVTWDSTLPQDGQAHRVRVSLKLADAVTPVEAMITTTGPLPPAATAVLPTSAPPTSTPTVVPPTTIPPTALPPPTSAQNNGGNAGGLPILPFLGLGVLLLAVLGFALTRRKPAPPAPRKCPKCGYAVGNAPICPMCGTKQSG